MAMWIGVTFVLLTVLYAAVIFTQHARSGTLTRSRHAGIVVLIYVGVLEVSIIQEAVFYPA